MKRKSNISIIMLILLITGLTGYFSSVSAQEANPVMKLSESELVFSGLVGETLQRTITVSIENGVIYDLEIIIPDLIDPSSKSVILSDRITISPSDLSQISGNQVLTISISGLDRYGNYEGDLLFRYSGMPEDTDMRVRLFVNLRAVPSVDADVNSKSLTLFVEPSILDLPMGKAESSISNPILGEVVLSLIQVGDSPAVIKNARVLAMQSSQGRTLPEDTVRVVSEFPIGLEANDAATLRVVAQGRNLPAGEFNGTLLVNVENQLGPVQIPLAVQVKDGPILAFILLAAGPIVGILFFYWNKDGKSLLEARQRIANLQRILHTGRFLTIQDQEQIRIKLESLMESLLNKADSGEIDAKLVEIDDFLKGQQAIGEQLYLSLQTLKDKLGTFGVGQFLRDDLNQKIVDLQKKLESGSSSSLETVQQQIELLQTSVADMEMMIQDYQAFEPDKQAIMLPRLENARSVEEFRGILTEARDIIPKAIKDIFKTEESIEKPEWRKFNLVLQWRRIAVSLVVYLFTLFVGWITLYGSSPTFGANREDYITLFLWGVASNVVGGQAIDLKSIFMRQEGSGPLA